MSNKLNKAVGLLLFFSNNFRMHHENSPGLWSVLENPEIEFLSRTDP